MLKREIIKALIERKDIPERMGICEDFWPETIDTTWPQQGLPRDTEAASLFDWDMVDLQEYWKGGRFDPQAIVGGGKLVEEDDETRVVTTGWGTTVRVWKAKNGTPEHIDFDMTSPKIWRKKYREHLLNLDTRRFRNLEGMKERYRRYTDQGYFTMYNSTFVFENMRYSMGDVRMLEAFILDPEWIHDFCSVYTDFTIMHVEYLFREVGVPDGYTIYDDMAYTTSSFASPRMYKEMITPYHKKFVDFLKSYNVAVILHSCGNVESQMENIIEAGIDCIQPLEAKTGMDLIDMGRRYGDKISFMGNIDIRALETNDHRKIEEEIIPKLNSIRENKIPYIFHTDHSVSPLVKIPSYEYALQLFRENCKY